MKLTGKQRKYIRFGLWTAGLCWGLFFFTYSMVLLPSILEMVSRFATSPTFSTWTFGVFYVLVVVTGVVIFFWFFSYLMGRKKR